MTERKDHHEWKGYLDGYLKNVLDTAKTVIRNDWDKSLS